MGWPFLGGRCPRPRLFRPKIRREEGDNRQDESGSQAEAVGVEWLPCENDTQVESTVAAAQATLAAGRSILVDVAIDYSEKTYFTRGVVKTMLSRLAWPDRLRFISRALVRRLSGGRS